jgi:hypothetical protein
MVLISPLQFCVSVFVLNSSAVVTEKEMTGWKILLVFEKCTLLVCYTVSSGNFLFQTFAVF